MILRSAARELMSFAPAWCRPRDAYLAAKAEWAATILAFPEPTWLGLKMVSCSNKFALGSQFDCRSIRTILFSFY